jgi:7-cyano-7-deazaguanine synthase in queuosine biosynthesis
MEFVADLDIVLFSGGLDSTYLLWKMLNEQRNIHVHHVSIRSHREPMWKEQDEAVKKILEHLWAIRPFKYTESVYEWFCSDQLAFDTDVVISHAQPVVKMINPEIRIHLHIGWTPEDMKIPIVQERVKHDVSNNLWRALKLSLGNPPNLPDILTKRLVDDNITKKDMLQELPPELLELTWTCRTPVHGKKCNMCSSCQERRRIELEIERDNDN